jgi:hypothetical protein
MFARNSRTTRSMVATLVVVALAAALSPPAWAQVPRQPNSLGVVLLDNGQVLHGNVTLEGEQALVTLGPGSQMRLPRTQIAGTGRTLDDLFQLQHRRLEQGDVAGRLDLARWCLRSDMPAKAGQLLVELVKLAPDDSRVRNLELQLRQQTSQPRVASDASRPTIPPTEELSEISHQISPPAFDAYMRQVQPLLINHCSASGCHGVASKSSFQLLRPWSGSKLTQRMTQRNLHAVLAQVDRAAPLESPLLLAATQLHATIEQPLLREQTDRAEREALVAWLTSLGEKTVSPQAPSATTEILPQVLLQPKSGSLSQLPAVNGSSPRTSPAEVRQPPTARRELPDADDFNRRFFPDRFPAAPSPRRIGGDVE